MKILALRHSNHVPRRRQGSMLNANKIIDTLGINSYFIPPSKYPLQTKLDFLIYNRSFGQRYYNWSQKGIDTYTVLEKSDVYLCTENYITLKDIHIPDNTILWIDASIGSLIDFYPYLTNLSIKAKEGILYHENQVLQQCSDIIVASQWSKERLLSIYNLPERKVHIIERIPYVSSSVRVKDNYFNIVFVSNDWNRKNGEMAIRLTQSLYQLGFNVRLHLIGDHPRTSYPYFVEPYGYLSNEEISRVYEKCQVFLSTTNADVVYTSGLNAQAHGCLYISPDVGGCGEYADLTYTDEKKAKFLLTDVILNYEDYAIRAVKDETYLKEEFVKILMKYRKN